MNDRIKELAVKAGFVDKGSNHTAYMSFDHENFAELIKHAIYDRVKEELIPDDIIAEEQVHHQEYLRGCNAGTVDALCHIKNFGVDDE